MRRFWGWWLGLVCTSAGAVGWEPAPVFEPLGVAEGLPSSRVYALAFDPPGRLWIATGDGLARWDGVAFRVWRQEPGNPRSLPANDVQTVHVDDQGQVWAGVTDGGLVRIEADGGVTSFRHDPVRADTLPSDEVWSIEDDGTGGLWIGTYGAGLARMDPVSGRVRRYPHEEGDPGTPATDDIIALHRDAAGMLWIGTSAGLTLADAASAGPRLDGVRQYLAGELVVSLRGDRDGVVWIGTRRGLFRARAGGGEPEPLPLPVEASIVQAAATDDAGTLWVATHRGVLLRGPEGFWRIERHVPGRIAGLPAGVVMDVQLDREGGTWFALLGGGLAHLRPTWRNAALLRETATAEELGASWPPALAPCPDGRLLVASPAGRLQRLDPRRRLTEPLPALDERLAAFGAYRLTAALCTRDGTLYVGHRFGVLAQAPDTGAVREWRGDDGDPTALLSGAVEHLVEARDGRIWVAAQGGGLHRLDPASGRVHRFRAGVDAPRSREFEQLHLDDDGVLWVAGNAGIDRHDPAHDRFAAIDGLPSGRVDAVTTGADGTLWTHALDGLRHGRLDGTRFVLLRELRAGAALPAAEAGMLVRDPTGALWLPGPRGLFRIDGETLAVRRYGRADGLPLDELPKRPQPVLAGGVMLLSTPIGALRIDPLRLRDNRVPPRVVLESVVVRRDGAWMPLDPSRPLRLDHRDGELRVTVRALSLADPAANRYRFLLEGHDADWVVGDADGSRRLPPLPPGRYRLRAEAANAHGVFAAWPETLAIDVRPPPWRTAPAYALYLVAGFAALAAVARSARRRAERRAAFDLALERRRAAERASEGKSAFVADVGHEIGTPMSGVLGMTELLLRTPLDERQRGYARTVQRSGEHLLALVNDLLDLARIEAGRLPLHPVPCILVALLDEVAATVAPLAAERGLAFAVRHDAGLPAAVRADPVRVRQILLNLLHNALKFTERGSVSLRATPASAVDGTPAVCFEVADSGPGLTPETRAALFERFAQGESGRRHGGSGLGLAIVGRLVDAMRGHIAVESAENAGTVFRITLPLPECTPPDGSAPAPRREAPGRRLLLVEDDEAIREALAELLRAERHAVVAVPHGLAALTALAGGRFDLALLDLDLPGIDGLTLARLVRERHAPALPLVAVTARSDPALADTVAAAGFARLLRKPVLARDLLAAVDELALTEAAAAVDADQPGA